MITPFVKSDLEACAGIMCQVYNNEQWQGRWSLETASTYLGEYVAAPRFVGYTARVEGVVVGAIFCHAKTWWNASELSVDELFVMPERQRQGFGTALLQAAEEYVREQHLAA